MYFIIPQVKSADIPDCARTALQKSSQKNTDSQSLVAYYLSTVVKSIHSPEAKMII